MFRTSSTSSASPTSGSSTRDSGRPSTTSPRSRTSPARSPSTSARTPSAAGSPGAPLEDIHAQQPDQGVPREGPDLRGPADDGGRFVNRETGEIRGAEGVHGRPPAHDRLAGTFIINGTERVIVTQLVRSPGAYVMEPKDREKQVFIANLMPSRGSWVELEIDKKGMVNVRIDRKRKLPVTTLLFSLGYTRDDIANLFRHPDDTDARQPVHRDHARDGPHRGRAADGQPQEPRRDRGRREGHRRARRRAGQRLDRRARAPRERDRQARAQARRARRARSCSTP